ncbi:MAG: HEAT repeat domain-containing protein [Planctomycetota bacterium]|nr:MAG: HEAT repeat domain-containing protein [Planctomycetota bacterium]
MKIGLPLKLGLGVILLFAVMLAFVFSYKPLHYRWLESMLMSSEASEREKAFASIRSDGPTATPYLERWLESENDKLFLAACRILVKVNPDILDKYHARLHRLVNGKPSPFTDDAAAAIDHRVSDWMDRYDDDPARQRNMYCYRLKYHESWKVRKNAAQALGHLRDPDGIARLINASTKEKNPNVRQSVVWALGEIGDERSVEPLQEATANDKDEDVRRLSSDALQKIKSRKPGNAQKPASSRNP